MIPMFDRRLNPDRIRVCKSPVTGNWFAERLKTISTEGRWGLYSQTSEGFPTYAEAAKLAASWLPKEGPK